MKLNLLSLIFLQKEKEKNYCMTLSFVLFSLIISIKTASTCNCPAQGSTPPYSSPPNMSSYSAGMFLSYLPILSFLSQLPSQSHTRQVLDVDFDNNKKLRCELIEFFKSLSQVEFSGCPIVLLLIYRISSHTRVGLSHLGLVWNILSMM